MFAQRINMSLHRAARIITAVFSFFSHCSNVFVEAQCSVFGPRINMSLRWAGRIMATIGLQKTLSLTTAPDVSFN